MTATFSNAAGLGIPLPPPDLRLMSDSDERFLQVGRGLTELLYQHGLTDTSTLLDVGCSVGRLPIALLAFTGYQGKYRGFDVTPRHVRWAKDNLAPISPNLRFRYVDVRNDRYNPNGTVDPRELRFPAKTEAYDMACLFSIFTHFYKEDIQLYLHELHRILKPGGRIVVSWFLYDDKTYDAAVSGAYPMTHRLDEHTIYNDPDDPLRAIAFHEDKVREMIAAAGLEIVTVAYGHWSGRDGVQFQDHLVLRRPPLTVAQRLRRKAGALKRRILR